MNQNTPSKLLALLPLLSETCSGTYERKILTITLCNAAASGETNTLKVLLAKYPRLINAHDEMGKTALHYAVCRGRKKTISLLLARGANVNCKTRSQHETPLHFAVQNQQLDIISTLLNHNAEVDCRNGNGITPLLSACSQLNSSASQSSKAIITRLLEARADINQRTNEGCPFIYSAVRLKNPSLVKHLIDIGAQANWWDRWQRTPLHQAALSGDDETIKVLITGGADPDGFNMTAPREEHKPDSNLCPPISLAIVEGHSKAVRTLAESGASLHLDVRFAEAIYEALFPLLPDDIRNDAYCGQWSHNHSLFKRPMSPLRFCVLTEKTDILSILLQKGQYSRIEIADMENLAQNFRLDKSTQALDCHREYIPPASLKVLCGRTIKNLTIERNSDTNQAIAQLPIPTALHHFLQWQI